MKDFKYKYRPLTTRIPPESVMWFVETMGPALRMLSKFMARGGKRARSFREQWIPYRYYTVYGSLGEAGLAELSEHDTFDALTPKYDLPLTQAEFYGEIERTGFRIVNRQENLRGPLWCTAVRR